MAISKCPPPLHLSAAGLDDFPFQDRTLSPGSIKVSGYAKGAAGRILTAGVIEQHDVVQGDVALPLLGNCCFEDDLQKKRQVEELRQDEELQRC